MNIFSLSFGKDSMATIILAAEQGIPIDRVLYADIKFNDEISGEHPIMAEWIPTAEKKLKELFGVTVDHVYSGVSFYEQFYKVKQKGNHVGDIYGFPHAVAAWCNSCLKIKAISKYISQFHEKTTQFVGIAYDEPRRWERMKAKETSRMKYRSLLYEQRMTEQDAKAICERYGLLSPVYSIDGIFRGGCWFCPKQCMSALWSLWKNYPDLYNRLLEMEPYSHTAFKPRGGTLAYLAERFSNGYRPPRKPKK